MNTFTKLGGGVVVFGSTDTKQPLGRKLPLGSQEIRAPVSGWGSFVWDFSLGNFCLWSFACELSLGHFRVETFARELSLWIFRLETFSWDLSLGVCRLGCFGNRTLPPPPPHISPASSFPEALAPRKSWG